MEDEITRIKVRNKRVEEDKAWETSWTRTIFIAVITYFIAGIWLILIHDSMPWLKAIVPVAGYILSTLSLPFLKKWWLKHHE